MRTFHMHCDDIRRGTITKNTLQRLKDNLDKVAQLSIVLKINIKWDSLIQKLNGLCEHTEGIVQLYLHLTPHVEGKKPICL